MPNYAETQLYELIEYDENGEPVVYRGHTTGPLRKRLSVHRSNFKSWLNGKKKYCSSYEVLKHGNARIELVRVVCCLNKKDASRAEGLFIRELPTCVNIRKNYEKKEYYEANKQKLIAKQAEYYEANKEVVKAKHAKYYETNKEVVKEYYTEYYEANKQKLIAKQAEYYEANKEVVKAREAEKVTCECGAVICRGKLSRHRNTLKHIHDFIHL